MSYEVELKYPLPPGIDDAAFARQLADLGAHKRATARQLDRYFNHPSRDFAQTDEALRLRWSGGEPKITYKGPKIDPTTKTRREIELPLGRSEADLAEASQMLLLLGFREVATVAKSRTFFELIRAGRAFEITLDHVDQVGAFIELETAAEETDLAAAKESLFALARELHLTTPERKSYLELLLIGRSS